MFDKLYLEFGGKLIDDQHAARTLPGFLPDLKIRLLQEFKDDAEVILCINANAIEKFAHHSSQNQDEILFKTHDKDEYERKLATMSQEKLLAMQWVKAGMDNTEKTIQAKNQMHLFQQLDLVKKLKTTFHVYYSKLHY